MKKQQTQSSTKIYRYTVKLTPSKKYLCLGPYRKALVSDIVKLLNDPLNFYTSKDWDGYKRFRVFEDGMQRVDYKLYTYSQRKKIAGIGIGCNNFRANDLNILKNFLIKNKITLKK